MRADEAGSLTAGNRILKVLEDAQIKLDCVASDALGMSGRLILEQMVKGETDPDNLAGLALGNLKKKKKELRQALDGKFTDHHRFEVQLLLQMVKEYEDKALQLDQRIERYLAPYEDLVARLDEIPGIDRVSVAAILAGIGPDMSHWDDSEKLASWSCLCPGNRESGGRRLSGKTRKGNRWLRRIFCQMAWAATRKKGGYFKTQYRRISKRRGNGRALMAVAHSLLTVIYHMIKEPNLRYRDLGEDYFDKRDAIQTAKNCVHRLEKLGFEVNLKPREAA
jgi:transposase